MDGRHVALVERIVIGGVAMTARALAASSLELTFLQWRVLVVLGDHAEGLPVGELGRRIGASPPSASRVVRRLERQGYATVHRDERDRRRVLVCLSADGSAVRESVMAERRSLIAAALDGIAIVAAPAELPLLASIAGALDAER